MSRNVLSVTSSCVSVAEALMIRALSSGELATSVRTIDEVPARSVKCSPASSVAASSALLSTTLSASARFVTASPRMPLPRLLRIFMRVSETLRVDVRDSASPVVLWIVPPVQASAVVAHAPPAPVTVSPPAVPVVLSTMPFAAPLAATRWKVTPAAAMFVLATFSAVPVPVSTVLPEPLTWRVPPPVAIRPAPDVVSRSRPPPENTYVWPVFPVALIAGWAPVLRVLAAPEKTVEPPVLPDSAMPPPASPPSLSDPLRLTTPPVRPVTLAVDPVPSPMVPG